MKKGKFINRKVLENCSSERLRDLYYALSGEKLNRKIEVDEIIEIIIMKCDLIKEKDELTGFNEIDNPDMPV